MGDRGSRRRLGAGGYVRRTSLSDDLIRGVLGLIREGDLKPGDRLPPVRNLAAMFSVAAPTMRDALGRLQTSGVLEMRHGSGTYVRNGRERIVVANPGREDLEPGRVLDLLSARRLIEPPLATLATRRAEDEDIETLREILYEAEKHVNRDALKSHQANARFHCEIANISGNSILSEIVQSLLEIYSFEQFAIISFYEDRSTDHEEHLAIFDAMSSGDAEAAGNLMERHIASVESMMKARLTEVEEEGRGVR